MTGTRSNGKLVQFEIKFNRHIRSTLVLSTSEVIRDDTTATENVLCSVPSTPAAIRDEGFSASLAKPSGGKKGTPYAYLRDLFICLANGHLAKDIDALMPWAYAQRIRSTPQ